MITKLKKEKVDKLKEIKREFERIKRKYSPDWDTVDKETVKLLERVYAQAQQEERKLLIAKVRKEFIKVINGGVQPNDVNYFLSFLDELEGK